MVLSFVTYMKNRRIGSTYPSIDAKPDSRVKRLLRKLGDSLTEKYIRVMNSMPFIRPRLSTGLINIIELQGMWVFKLNRPECVFNKSNEWLNTFYACILNQLQSIIKFIYVKSMDF